jgi:hypothetical protein
MEPSERLFPGKRSRLCLTDERDLAEGAKSQVTKVDLKFPKGQLSYVMSELSALSPCRIPDSGVSSAFAGRLARSALLDGGKRTNAWSHSSKPQVSLKVPFDLGSSLFLSLFPTRIRLFTPRHSNLQHMPRGYSELIEIAPTALLDLVDDVRRKWSNLTPEEDSHVRRWQSQARRLILQCFNLIATGNIFGLERDSPAVKVPHYEYGRLDVQLRSLLSDIGPGRACPTPSSLVSSVKGDLGL